MIISDVEAKRWTASRCDRTLNWCVKQVRVEKRRERNQKPEAHRKGKMPEGQGMQVDAQNQEGRGKGKKAQKQEGCRRVEKA
jgi:hypothetical protein